MSTTLHKVKQKTLDTLQKIKNNPSILIRILPFVAFFIPLLILYSWSSNSFETTWKGRTYYLFFIWLILLEIILDWEKLRASKLTKLWSIRTAAFAIVILLPTIYVLVTNFSGLNSAIVTWSKQFMGDWFAESMPLCIEYLVFGTIFVAISLTAYGKKGLRYFSMPTFLLFAIGTFYTIDNLYPNGQLPIVQVPALPTTILAASVFNMMGYGTSISYPVISPFPGVPLLSVWDLAHPLRATALYVGWPCAGVDSFLIYAFTILFFLRNTTIQLKYKVIYFIVGAVITYFINILRIVTIFLLAIDYGTRSLIYYQFHSYYGPLYSITWIMAYPIIIIGSRALWGKIKNRTMVTKPSPVVKVN
jgi:exosortase/archaeosortase family protein